ncbi:hypothetical protein TTHT_2145 [Thermotomaculum hydrothermale]|uniref:Divergent polysaccharide deacetylase family protein n=1 Tax=Thermotomaculum hydrothermale TaxID=981385 RepID=A0A7R6PP11_9BACT|nr:divergent polysaccharide deacetylase family protein [Thermotomaculum hydrothermale]BBB33577.1 hypothetical protein TTHT_2145 [Thermotomaculum hydrothermale]
MATKKRRPKRRKKKNLSILKWTSAIFAIVIIGIFLYFLFNSPNRSKSVEQAIKNAYHKTLNSKPVVEKTFDEKANIVYKVNIPLKSKRGFLKNLRKQIPSNFKIKEIDTKNKILLKVDSGKEISKILITLKQKTRKPKIKKKTKQKYMYEEPLPKETAKQRKYKKRIKIKGQPLVAIVIDDCGIGHMESFEKALTIPYPITFAVLPFRTYSKRCAYLANGKGYRVILHMPMEPISYPKADPGPGAIFKTDRKKEILQKLNNAFSNIVFAEGFNNHMGSAITQSRFAVRVFLSYAEKHGKFFLDSRTTPHTVVEEEAKKLGIKVLSRDVFLDNVIEYSHIKKQLEETVKKAYEHGYAIAIGHNYPTTINVLSKEMPKLDKKVNFVFVRDLYYGTY